MAAGRLPEAQRSLDRALSLAGDTGEMVSVVEAFRLQGELFGPAGQGPGRRDSGSTVPSKPPASSKPAPWSYARPSVWPACGTDREMSKGRERHMVCCLKSMPGSARGLIRRTYRRPAPCSKVVIGLPPDTDPTLVSNPQMPFQRLSTNHLKQACDHIQHVWLVLLPQTQYDQSRKVRGGIVPDI